MTNVPTLPDPPETLMGAFIGADGGILTTAEITENYIVKANNFESRHEKQRILPVRKQSNCTADQRLCFRYTNSTIPPLLKSKISRF